MDAAPPSHRPNDGPGVARRGGPDGARSRRIGRDQLLCDASESFGPGGVAARAAGLFFGTFDDADAAL
ncbi:MAG: hypothetical protein ACK52I_33700 [Pseudomonadota bacterium]